MGIGLMPHIPDDLVPRKVQCEVEPDRELHDTEIGGQMSSIDGCLFNDEAPDLSGKLLKLPL